MTDPRLYVVTMPDGSVWSLPVQDIKEAWMEERRRCYPDVEALLYAGEDAVSTDAKIRALAIQIPWQDLWDNGAVTCVTPSEHPDPSEYALSWITGPWQVTGEKEVPNE